MKFGLYTNECYKTHYINDDNLTEELILVDETEIEYNTTVAPIIAYLLRKAVVDAVKDFGKQAVIDAVMKELDLPKVISGKNLVKKLKKVVVSTLTSVVKFVIIA